MEKQQQPHIAIIPSPGMGHHIPLIQFANRLVLRHNFSVTFLVSTFGPPSQAEKSAFRNLSPGVNHIFLPPVSFDDFPEDVKAQLLISLTITRSLPSIRDCIKSLMSNSNFRLVALVFDLFSIDTIELADEFSVPPYVFFTSSFHGLSMLFDLSKADWKLTEPPEPVGISGSTVLIHPRDIPEPLDDRESEASRQLVNRSKLFHRVEGIIVNSFTEMEPNVCKYLQGEAGIMPRIYPVGPVIRSGSEFGAEQSEIIKWLDQQPQCSVLFVSFGSGGTLSREQIDELASGLELSEQRFLWVVRSPNEKTASGSYFDSESKTEPFGFLPDGFLDRTKNHGLVVSSWAPQIEVLKHGSTAGFLTHCGWNSTLESLVHGVPMIAWPLFAEQGLNAVVFTEELKVAVRVQVDENVGLVEREEIARVVKALFCEREAEEIRGRVKRLKDAAAEAVGKEGSSTKGMDKLVAELMNGARNRR